MTMGGFHSSLESPEQSKRTNKTVLGCAKNLVFSNGGTGVKRSGDSFMIHLLMVGRDISPLQGSCLAKRNRNGASNFRGFSEKKKLVST